MKKLLLVMFCGMYSLLQASSPVFSKRESDEEVTQTYKASMESRKAYINKKKELFEVDINSTNCLKHLKDVRKQIATISQETLDSVKCMRKYIKEEEAKAYVDLLVPLHKQANAKIKKIEMDEAQQIRAGYTGFNKVKK